MKINENNKIKSEEVHMDGAKDVKMQILIGTGDESDNIIMRKFQIAPGGHTPRHAHNYEHVVKFEGNKGIMLDKDGKEYEVGEGQSAYVSPNELHQFKNPFDKPFEFICIIPNQEKK